MTVADDNSFEIYSIEFDPETLETTVNGGMKCPMIRSERDDLGFKLISTFAEVLGLQPDARQIEGAKRTVKDMESMYGVSTSDFIQNILNSGKCAGVPTQDAFQWVKAVDILKAVNQFESL